MFHARTSRGVRTLVSCGAAGVLLSLCGSAGAAMTLRIDVNSLTVEAGSGFDGETHSGVLNVMSDGDSTLEDMRIDAVSHGGDAGLAGLIGEIRLENGVVTGGGFELTLTDNTSYTALIGGGTGDVDRQQGQGFSADGLTDNGRFDDLTDGIEFGGIDVSEWFEQRGSLAGSFYLFGFSPDATGADSDVNLELYLTAVPAPGSVALAGVGVMMANRRKRRTL